MSSNNPIIIYSSSDEEDMDIYLSDEEKTYFDDTHNILDIIDKEKGCEYKIIYDNYQTIWIHSSNLRQSPRYYLNPNKILEHCLHIGNDNLIPSSEQVIQIKKCGDFFNKMTLQYWYDYMTDLKIFSNSSHNESLMIRAEELLRITIVRNFKTFVYLDGHGRFTYFLMKAIVDNGLNLDYFQFKTIDINEFSYEWHNNFFPTDILNYEYDIFEFISESKEVNFIPYFNFCGLGGAITNNDKKLIKILKDDCEFMLSFSIIRKAYNHYKELESILKHYGEPIQDGRDDFISYIVILL